MSRSIPVIASRIQRAVSDVFGLFLAPATLALLPWPISYRALRWMANQTPAFRSEADVAWRVMREQVGHADERAWKARYKLIRWVERVDTYLTLTRSAAWWLTHVDRHGEWPRAGVPCLFLTYHWGAGHWIWKCLRERGIRAYFLARRPQIADLGVSRVSLWFGRLRGWSFARIGSLGPIYTGGSRAQVHAAFAEGCSVLGMLDLPTCGSRGAYPVRLLGRPALFHSGLVELAHDAGLAIALVSCGFDARTGRRQLNIEVLPENSGIDMAMERYAMHLDARLREAPEYWMMWHEARAIFQRGADDPER